MYIYEIYDFQLAKGDVLALKHFDVETVTKLIVESREQLGFNKHGHPKVDDVIYDEETDTLFIIVPDRPEKSAIVGKGGWAIAELRKKLDVWSVSVHTTIDITIKKMRIQNSIDYLQGDLKKIIRPEVHDCLLKTILPLLEDELKYPLNKRKIDKIPECNMKVAVALSDGPDSMATLALAKRIGLNPDAFTVDLGPLFIPPKVNQRIDEILNGHNIKRYMVPRPEGHLEIQEKARKGRIHPCGACHDLTTNALYRFAKENKYDIIMFGEFLPTGRYAFELIDDSLLRINLPAALALTKIDTIKLAESMGVDKISGKFGCQFLNMVHIVYPEMRYPSIKRVLREAHAGVLPPSIALKYIKSIIVHRKNPKAETKFRGEG